MDDSILRDGILETLEKMRRDGTLPESRTSVAPSQANADSRPMSDTDRIAHLTGAHDGIKQSQTILVSAVAIIGGILIAAVALVLTLQVFTFQRIDAVEAKLGTRIDAIPQQLTEEFRAMRAETAAQTSAIANSVTAARQVQPQILIMPSTTNTDRPPTSNAPSMTGPGRPPG